MLGKKNHNKFINSDKKKEKNKKKSRFGDRIRTEKNPLTNKLYSNRYFRILKQRQQLPAYESKNDFLEMIRNNDIIIVQGETGSGKTTQIPQYLMEEFADDGKLIGVTQPRRVAAISVAKRVSEETDTTVGDYIGYSVRFNESVSVRTKLKYMTDGMLLRESMSDSNLSRYSVIVLDEAHERTLSSDILLAMMKKLVKKKRENKELGSLKLVVMSATIEVERFAKYFDEDVPVLSIPGRCHPVEIFYTSEPEPDYLAATIRTAVQIHCFEPRGDVLVFLTGEDEITQAVNQTRKQIDDLKNEVGPALVLPLFSAMSNENQQRIFAPAPEDLGDLPGRKIIFSTNIAETSLTIDGVVYVIDPGLSKQKVYNPRLKIESLLVAPISKASAKQRAGRAGRTQSGKCFRLYTEDSYKNDLEDFTISEVLRSDLCAALMQLKSLGVENLIKFDFIEPPSPETMLRALDSLVMLGVFTKHDGGLTNLGKVMSMFPLEPKYTKVLFAAASRNCFNAALSIISVITCGNWRIRDRSNNFQSDAMQRKFIDSQECDLMTVLNVFNAFNKANNKFRYCRNNYLNFRTLNAANNVRRQLLRIAQRCPSKGFALNLYDKEVDQHTLSINLKKSFLEGFYPNVAHLQKSGTYKVLKENHMVLIHPSSSMKSKKDYVLYLEFVLTSRNYIRMVTSIQVSWLLDMFPEYYNQKNIPGLVGHSAVMQKYKLNQKRKK
jgi:pre-mRNA-splicing factor ATP-dependent RNA helicase DHX15/PRP43